MATMPRWTLIVAFVLVLWLATSAGLCTAKSDAPKSLCRPRLHQAAGNLEEMGRIDVNTTRLLHAQVTLRSPSSLSECLIRRLSSSVSHSLSFIRYLGSLCLIPCLILCLVICVSFSVSHSLSLILCLSSSVSHSHFHSPNKFSSSCSLCLVLCVSSLPVCLVLCVSSSVPHLLCLVIRVS